MRLSLSERRKTTPVWFSKGQRWQYKAIPNRQDGRTFFISHGRANGEEWEAIKAEKGKSARRNL